MLTRATRLSPFAHSQCRYFAFSTAAFDAFSERVNKLRSSYPNLFNSSSFLSEQEKLLSSYQSNVSSLLSEYDSARQAIANATGESVYAELTEEQVLNDLNSRNRPFYDSLTETADISGKLEEGKEYVDRVIRLQSEQKSASSVEEQNLKMIEIAKYGDKIDEWLLRFEDALNDSSDLGLPISDLEVDEFVKEQYHHAPDEVREQGLASYDQHKQVEEDWMMTLDEKLIEVLRERDSNFDESKFREFCKVTNELFHPHSIDHYGMSNYAKSLFRAALWQSQDRCNAVEQSIEKVVSLLEDGRDDSATIMRGVYESNPDTRHSNLVALQLRITDPLFAAKLIQHIRFKLEQAAIERAQKDILRDLEVPYLQSEREELQTELEVSMSTNPANMRRGIQVLQSEEASFNVEVPSLDEVLDEVLPSALWNNDTSAVKQAITAYASGSGSLSDVDAAIDATLNSKNASADTSGLDDSEILSLSVKYHNARQGNLSTFNFEDFLAQCAQKKDIKSMLENRRIAYKKLNAEGVDPLVVNLVRILIEDGSAVQLQRICSDYLDIMKRFRGEIEGFVTSAQEMDEATFQQIRSAIENANPGKKITLERTVDPGLQSGFIVKAGVQRFDFSLATVIHQGRMQVGTV
eukprot:CAMPEP_0197020296 /NCGR_PEP_ID=MMETSP1384-20130603/1075_1 /TAXON_ID=29189 /ORGANISM="Ammonia sp." /LENGTH=635 /DNA_ID=CAMNT_0042447899 /DNA_START=13 /DNA_END=1920 /DNA_ORIENTATION=+